MRLISLSIKHQLRNTFNIIHKTGKLEVAHVWLHWHIYLYTNYSSVFLFFASESFIHVPFSCIDCFLAFPSLAFTFSTNTHTHTHTLAHINTYTYTLQKKTWETLFISTAIGSLVCTNLYVTLDGTDCGGGRGQISKPKDQTQSTTLRMKGVDKLTSWTWVQSCKSNIIPWLSECDLHYPEGGEKRGGEGGPAVTEPIWWQTNFTFVFGCTLSTKNGLRSTATFDCFLGETMSG